MNIRIFTQILQPRRCSCKQRTTQAYEKPHNSLEEPLTNYSAKGCKQLLRLGNAPAATTLDWNLAYGGGSSMYHRRRHGRCEPCPRQTPSRSSHAQRARSCLP